MGPFWTKFTRREFSHPIWLRWFSTLVVSWYRAKTQKKLMSYQEGRQTDGWPHNWTVKPTQFHRIFVLYTNPKIYHLPTRDEVTPSVNWSWHPWMLHSLTTSALRHTLNKNRNSKSYWYILLVILVISGCMGFFQVIHWETS